MRSSRNERLKTGREEGSKGQRGLQCPLAATQDTDHSVPAIVDIAFLIPLQVRLGGGQGCPLYKLAIIVQLVSAGCHHRYHRLGGLNNRDLFSHSSGG